MIVIAGGTGTLGTQVVQLLAAHGLPLRVLTRDPARAGKQLVGLAEIVEGDVRDRAALLRASAGAETVVSAVQGFAGVGGVSPRTVDAEGNHNLIEAAQASGVTRFILLSVHGAAPDHPMELHRMKARAEQELRAGGLDWTIIRPTAYMETWGALIGLPLLRQGRTRVFGRGDNPINFISAHDVARYVELAVTTPALSRTAIDVGGPENLTLRQIARVFMDVTGAAGDVSAVPLPLMRVMALVMRAVNPALARQIQAGIVMDTTDMTFDPAETLRRFPSVTLTTFAEAVRRDFGEPALRSHVAAGKDDDGRRRGQQPDQQEHQHMEPGDVAAG